MTRLSLAVAGALAASYGVWLLLDLGVDNLVATGIWLVTGVLLHDAVLAPATIVVCLVAGRLLPDRWRAPGAFVLLVLGSTSLVALPMLGRFGARGDNPTLLDRDYLAGWLVVAALTLVAAVFLAQAGRRPRRTSEE